jgi:molybdenum storage protein
MLMRESMVDKEVMASTDVSVPVVRMLPHVHIVKIGARSILEAGKEVTYSVVDVLNKVLEKEKLILSTGGGARSRHVFSIGIDLGLPTGVLAQLSAADALGNAHILGTLLSPVGVVAIPPEIFGHLLPLFIRSAPGVIFNGVPPYNLWEHLPAIGRIPPNRSDAGSFLLGECFGCKTVTLVKDVDGLYDSDPNENPDAKFIPKIGAHELQERNIKSLPFDRILLDLLHNTRLVKQFQVVNGHKPETIAAAVRGEHVGSIIHSDN